jgi:hypothetical protein
MRAKSKHRRFAGKLFWRLRAGLVCAKGEPARVELETRRYLRRLNPADGLKLIKFRARGWIGTDWRGFPDDVKPRLILVTHWHMRCECIMQFGFKLIPSKPSHDTSK